MRGMDSRYQCYPSTMFTVSIGSMPSGVACEIYGVAIIGTSVQDDSKSQQQTYRLPTKDNTKEAATPGFPIGKIPGELGDLAQTFWPCQL